MFECACFEICHQVPSSMAYLFLRPYSSLIIVSLLILFWAFAFLRLKTSCQCSPIQFSPSIRNWKMDLSLKDDWRLASCETPSESHGRLPETPGISWNWPFLRAWKLMTMPPIGPGNTPNPPHEVRRMRSDIAGVEGHGCQNGVCQAGESTSEWCFEDEVDKKQYLWSYVCAWMKIYWNLDSQDEYANLL